MKDVYEHIKEFKAFSFKQNYDEVFTSSKLYYLLDKSTWNHSEKTLDASNNYHDKYSVTLSKKILVQAISKIILGTVQFGLNYGINNTTGKPNQQEVNEILSIAYDAGIKILDTAEAYGDAHVLIGKFHETFPNRKFSVLTKFPHIIESDTFEYKVDKYIKQMAVTQLEALLFHSYDSYKENINSIPLLNNLIKKEKIKYLGVSVYTNEQMEEVLFDNNIHIIQLPFNLFDNNNQRGDLIKKAREKGKIIHTRSAFLQGLFFMSINSDHQIAKLLNKELLYINQLGKSNSVPLQKLALNYCLQQKEIDNVLIGVDNLEQLKQNLTFADEQISTHLIEKIEKIKVRNTDLLNPSLWNR